LRLQAPLLLDDQALDQRAFRQAAPVMLLQDAEVDQDIAVRLVADDEAEAAGRVEPFHRAGEMQQILLDGFRARPIVALGNRGCSPGKHIATRRHVRLTP